MLDGVEKEWPPLRKVLRSASITALGQTNQKDVNLRGLGAGGGSLIGDLWFSPVNDILTRTIYRYRF